MKDQEPKNKNYSGIRGHRPKLAKRVRTYQVVLPEDLFDGVREAGPIDVRATLEAKYGLR